MPEPTSEELLPPWCMLLDNVSAATVSCRRPFQMPRKHVKTHINGENECLKILTFTVPRPPPTRRGRLEQAIRRLRRRLWGSAGTRFLYDPFLAFWGSAGDIFGLCRRHFFAPPATFLGSASDIFGLRRRHFCAPPTTFLGPAGSIFGLHFWAPPATFVG